MLLTKRFSFDKIDVLISFKKTTKINVMTVILSKKISFSAAILSKRNLANGSPDQNAYNASTNLKGNRCYSSDFNFNFFLKHCMSSDIEKKSKENHSVKNNFALLIKKKINMLF